MSEQPGRSEWVPIPDPTRLTTEAVERAADQWRRELNALRDVFTTRMDALETAAQLHLEAAAEIRPHIERVVNHLRQLHEEKFAGINARFDERNVWLHEKFDGIARQFAERDTRTEQAARAAKEALSAALSASKELGAQQNEAFVAATGKTEASTSKQIDEVKVRIETLDKTFSDRLNELKERMDRDQGATTGVKETHTDTRAFASIIIAIVSVLVAVIAVIAFAVK